MTSTNNMKLATLDDLLCLSDKQKAENIADTIQQLPISKLRSFHNHPFKVLDDDAMDDTVKSIQENGLIHPIIVRPVGDDIYEIVAGHRRTRAFQILGRTEIPALIRDLDDDAAAINVVESNLATRKTILVSEKAFAYKLKLEAMKHQGERSDLTSRHIGEKSTTSIDILAEESGEAKRQIQRYIRLTNLCPKLLDLVDLRRIGLVPAYDLSFLSPEEQAALVDRIEYQQATPTVSQAARLKKFSLEGKLTKDIIDAIMMETKKNNWGKIAFSHDVLKQYFPASYSPAKMHDTIIELLEQWQREHPDA